MIPPAISIIMPLYNKQPYVKAAIDSIKSQTFTDWELIIIDDGSTDGSMNEIPENDQQIRLFKQENAGPGAARNFGAKIALGEFITFLDADDYYYPHKLEQEIEFLKNKKKAEWMVSTYDYIRNNQVRLRKFQGFKGYEPIEKPLVLDKVLNQLLVEGWHVNGLCISKALFFKLGGFWEDLRCFEIIDFFIRCALIQPKVFIYPFSLYRVVDVPNSAFKVTSHRTEGSRKLGERFYDLSNTYHDYSNILRQKSKKRLFSYVITLIRSGNNKEARKYLSKKIPFSPDKRWLKLRILSWLPKWIFKINPGWSHENRKLGIENECN